MMVFVIGVHNRCVRRFHDLFEPSLTVILVRGPAAQLVPCNSWLAMLIEPRDSFKPARQIVGIRLRGFQYLSAIITKVVINVSVVGIDSLVSRTIFFKSIHVFVAISHDRRKILHFAVTANPHSQ